MKQCNSCGNFYPDANNSCPFCGAAQNGAPQPGASTPAAPVNPAGAPNPYAAGYDPFNPFGTGSAPQPPADGKKKKKASKAPKAPKAPKTPKAPKAPKTAGGAKKPLGPKAKFIGIGAGAVAVITAVAIILTSVLGVGSGNAFIVEGTSANSSVEVRDNVTVLENDKLEKKLEGMSYNEDTNEYTITYEQLPDQFKNLKQGDLFVVPTDMKAKNYAFMAGFSGKVSSVSATQIVFTVPKFDDVFSSFKMDNNSAQATGVAFIPNEGVEIDSEALTQLNQAALGNTASTNSITIGEYTAETTYKKTSRKSQLAGYNLLAKELSLKIEREVKLSEEEKYKISGKVKLEYPAVKFNIDYDSRTHSLNKCDLGIISKEEVSLKYTRSTTVVPPGSVDKDEIGNFGIIDLKDTADLEEGKIVLGKYLAGYSSPLSPTNSNGMPILGIGICFQVCLTIKGEIEFECETKESALINFAFDIDSGATSDIKSPDAPNPVFGEQALPGDTDDGMKIEISASGNVDGVVALSIDVGFSVLGTIPIKLAVDILNAEAAADFKISTDNRKLQTFFEDFNIVDFSTAHFVQLKQQVTCLMDFGAELKNIPKEKKKSNKKKDADEEAKEYTKEKKFNLIGEYALKAVIANNVFFQYPEPVKFTINECDFGGIQLGVSYTEDTMNDAYYQRKEETGTGALTGKAKDKLLQDTVGKIANKLNVTINDILAFLPFDGTYDINCYSDGAIYFSENGVVKAELITGDDVYNRSGLSHYATTRFVRMLYSEPQFQSETKFEVGALGEYVLTKVGLGSLMDYNGQDIKCYQYSSDDGANMSVFFDKDDDIIFIFVYEK